MLPSSILAAIGAVPVAELIIDGLAISCFNAGAATPRWEVAFLRPADHNLLIMVQQIDSAGRAVATVVPPTPIDAQVRSIDFNVTNGSDAHLGVYPGGGVEVPGFSRLGPDSVDHRWALNLGDPAVGNGNVIGLNRPPDPITMARIPHALFYTGNVTKSAVTLAPKQNNSPMGGVEIGRTNDDTSAVIFATGGADIQIVGDLQAMLDIALPNVASHYYKIILTNMDIGGHATTVNGRVRGDFRRYYDVVNVNGTQQDLWAFPNPVRILEGDCNPGFVRDPNVTTFQSLIDQGVRLNEEVEQYTAKK